jgi:hypothetical protein
MLMSAISVPEKVPNSLRIWFVIHFAVDMLFALPLLIAPVAFLTFIGWETVDPLATRIVGAALMAIGVESLMSWNANAAVYRAMLNLKIIWSAGVVFGILLTMLINGGPLFGWLVLAIFLVFNLIWLSYRLLLR